MTESKYKCVELTLNNFQFILYNQFHKAFCEDGVLLQDNSVSLSYPEGFISLNPQTVLCCESMRNVQDIITSSSQCTENILYILYIYTCPFLLMESCYTGFLVQCFNKQGTKKRSRSVCQILFKVDREELKEENRNQQGFI